MKHLFSITLVFQLLITPVWGQSLEETFSTTSTSASQGLTDQEQVNANNYYHQGIADKMLEEQCKKLKTGCNDTTSRPGNVLGGFEEVLPKLYAVMGTLAATGVGNKINMGNKGVVDANKKPVLDANGKQQMEKKEKTDVCIYIPLAGEAVATVTQQQAEQQIQQQNIQNQRDLQKEALYAVVRTQNSRAKTAKMQASVYAATGACYVAYMAMGASLKDPMLWVKMGAATAMSAIFFKKAGNHKKYAAQLKEIADKLPGAGECNPYTSTNCFCAESTSFKTDPTNFNRFCVPEAIANNGPPGTQTACSQLNSAGQIVVDAACKCKQDSTCFNTQFQGLVGQLGLSGINMNDPLSILDSTVGSFDEATLDSATLGVNAANTKALNGSIGNVPDSGLSGKTKEIADKIASLGVPSALSGALANQQSADLPASVASAPSLSPSATSGSGSAAAQLPGYNAAGARIGGNGNGDQGFVDPLAALNKGSQKTNPIQVETFAEKAIREAEITKDSSRNLFELITNRMRANGWNQSNSPNP